MLEYIKIALFVIISFIVLMIVCFILIYLPMTLYFKHSTRIEEKIHKKYSSEKEYIEKQVKKLQDLEYDYHKKIKILKEFCFEKDTFLKLYDKYKVYNLAETLIQERDNINNYTKSFENKLSKKEKSVLWEYIGNTSVDLKIEECEDICLKYDFYKECD